MLEQYCNIITSYYAILEFAIIAIALICKYCQYLIPYSGFFHGWKFSLFNFSWVDILAFGATLQRICIIEEILEELILAL